MARVEYSRCAETALNEKMRLIEAEWRGCKQFCMMALVNVGWQVCRGQEECLLCTNGQGCQMAKGKSVGEGWNMQNWGHQRCHPTV